MIAGAINPLAALGAAVRVALRSVGLATAETSERPADDVLLGCMALLAVACVPWSPLAGVVCVAIGVAWPPARARTKLRRRTSCIDAEMPLLVDLLAVGVHAGATPAEALLAVSGCVPGPLGDAVDGACARLAGGWLFADVLGELVADAGDAVRPLTTVLLAATRDGDPLAPNLERLSGELRLAQSRLLEAAARRLSVRLLLPLVACVLPAFALLTVAPLAVRSLRSLPSGP